MADRKSAPDSVHDRSKLDTLRIKIGGWTVGGIIGLILVVLLLVTLYAWQTLPPDLREVQELQGQDVALESYRELREEWFTEIKDLLQLLVVSLLIPLVTTVIGYIIGRQADAAAETA